MPKPAGRLKTTVPDGFWKNKNKIYEKFEC
jgi:hypothetical protein